VQSGTTDEFQTLLAAAPAAIRAKAQNAYRKGLFSGGKNVWKAG